MWKVKRISVSTRAAKLATIPNKDLRVVFENYDQLHRDTFNSYLLTISPPVKSLAAKARQLFLELFRLDTYSKGKVIVVEGKHQERTLIVVKG